MSEAAAPSNRVADGSDEKSINVVMAERSPIRLFPRRRAGDACAKMECRRNALPCVPPQM
jgi:hypothetical protein